MWDLTLRHRNSALRAAGAVVAALLLQSCATAGDGYGAIEADKAKQLEDARAQARAPFARNISTRKQRAIALHLVMVIVGTVSSEPRGTNNNKNP